MSNLITELGSSYCDQFYMNALFVKDGYLHRFTGCDSSRIVTAARCPLNREGPQSWRNVNVEADFFESMHTFAWPKLGYRELKEGDTRAVFFLTSTRSVNRGLRDDLIQAESLPAARVLGGIEADMRNFHNTVYLPAIFAPKFTSYAEGLEKLLSGSIMGFAMSEDLAVGISCTEGMNREYDIYFRQKVIGHLNRDGTAEISNKIIKRASVGRLLEKKASA